MSQQHHPSIGVPNHEAIQLSRLVNASADLTMQLRAANEWHGRLTSQVGGLLVVLKDSEAAQRRLAKAIEDSSEQQKRVAWATIAIAVFTFLAAIGALWTAKVTANSISHQVQGLTPPAVADESQADGTPVQQDEVGDRPEEG